MPPSCSLSMNSSVTCGTGPRTSRKATRRGRSKVTVSTVVAVSRPADLQARAEIEIWREAMAAELRRIPSPMPRRLAWLASSRATGRGAVSYRPASASATPNASRRSASPRKSPTRPLAGKWWGVSEEVLLSKLRRLGPAADLALEDAIARWHDGHFEATTEGFERAGLRIIPGPPADHRGGPAQDQG